MWDEITYPFPTPTVPPLKFGNEYVLSLHTLYGCKYLFMLGLELIYVSKRGPGGACVNLDWFDPDNSVSARKGEDQGHQLFWKESSIGRILT